jgi:catecholate siderophore receptor
MSINTKRPFSLRSPSKNALALGISAVLGSMGALAEEAIELDTLQIEERTIDTNPYAEAGAPYKAKLSGDARHVKPLADTPQTITVLTQTRIEESGKADMRDVLAQLPGITLGTGENGNAFGDRYVIRGYEARSDVFVDGMRDPGMSTRETFAAEQVEITKGPSSTFAGRGSSGGAVNTITKKASTEYDFSSVDAGIGTDSYHRLTLDTNKKVSDEVAVRANLLHSYKETPERSPADAERLGALLSGSYTPNDKFNIVADYYYLKAEDTPDLGTHFVDGKPAKNTPVYLQEELDFLDTKVGAFTLKMTYAFSDNFRVENGLRTGSTSNGYITSNGRSTGISSTHNGWQEVDYIGNQTNFILDTEFAGMAHKIVFGGEFTDESVQNGLYKVTTDASPYLASNGSFGPSMNYGLALTNGLNINKIWSGSVAKGLVDSDYNIDTTSLFLMDTIELTDKLSLFTGLRYDSFNYENIITADRGAGESTSFAYDDGYWNGHLSVVYDFADNANVYITYSTATDINGGESDVGGSCGYGGICGDSNTVGQGKPEDSENIELGTKWEFFDEKLLVSAAVFQITKSNVMEGDSANSYATTGTYNTGKNRVQGIEFSITGNITDKLSAQFNATRMDSEILDAYLDGTVEITSRGVTSSPNQIGKVLANFADDSLNLQLRYQASDAFSLGATATYSSEFYVGQPDTAASFSTTTGEYSYEVPSYSLFDVFANYKINEQLNLRVNINNITNEDYYTAAYRSGGFVYIGDKRSANLTLSYDF